MSTWIALVNFTDQGIKNIKGSPDRLQAFRSMAEGLGARVVGAWYTVGKHDIVTIIEGSDEAAATLLFKVGSMGNVRTDTMRAFTPEEVKGMVSKLQ